MDISDVLIVGGGPAGSSCAWKLRKAGIDVTVLDKAQFPRHKVCGGWITPPIIEELKLDLQDYQSQHVLQPITRFFTSMLGGPEVETDYGQTVSYGIRRYELDDYLLRRTGARLQLGESFRSMRRDGADWIVNDKYRTRVVIGAGGHFCPVSRELGSPSSNGQRPKGQDHRGLPVVMAQEVEFEMSPEQQSGCSIQPDRPELFFCPDLKGYAWVFRKKNYVNIGLGREGEDHLSTHISEFVDFLKSRGKITFPLEDRFHGHAYCLLTRSPQPQTDNGVLLIGDAVGLADRQSGEGIRPAIESGLLAADCIVKNGVGQQSELNADYQSRLRSRFQTEEGSGVLGWLPERVRRFGARQLMGTHWFSRRVLLDRWFLHRDLAPLSLN